MEINNIITVSLSKLDYKQLKSLWEAFANMPINSLKDVDYFNEIQEKIKKKMVVLENS